ncbi:hypothetical protein [uncultured Pseudokineococcus sp.]|uniref:hypothetical protein n=1 Tax=uncultured Pseudokineococcus sp. TaxID=1642928 RepID=UPI00261BBDE9|nr:hypothetical protein [uncultured Pseudokineococcus sp.]
MTLEGRPWIWDASPLVHARRADRLADIVDLAQRRSMDHRTTDVVLAEVRRGLGVGDGAGDLAWPVVDEREGVDWLVAVADLVVPLGVDGRHNLGEATCFALAAEVGGVLVIDDHRAAVVARRRGLAKIGVLGLLDDAERLGHHTMASAAAVVRDLAATGGRYPPDAVADFPSWCRRRRHSLGL